MASKPRFPTGGPCRHFNGIQNDACRAGVSFDVLARAETASVEGTKLPCLRVDGKKWCEQHDPFTPDEMQAQEAKSMEESSHVVNAMHGIAECKEKSGSITCPRCLGVLRFAHAPNGHIRARCETPDCLAFMS